ncbi:hypothetical protein NX02_07580 [Sphingomonas sanxanigenens DSM 19645 = NX02]|uniref:Multidrug transporter n=2 Tax=Sphingomonas sanxanigenens TaxID=397260 RepID=W0A809_9SPHN|nr:hypothetical protein NX02_07580 [Sphingomonas sanxanigenens DSM 19645 = NX02]
MLTKHPETGGFYVAALLGLKPDEPALITRDELAGTFRPLDVERRGFYLADDGIAIDPRDPRFGDQSGEPLFAADGRPGVALQRMTAIVRKLRDGLQHTDDFIAAMMTLKLVEPIDIELGFDDGDKLTLAGLYTISLDALADLADDQIVALFRAGHLQLAYAMTGSIRQFSRLAQRRNAGLSAPVR